MVDQDDRHVYQPGLLFVPCGLAHVKDIVRPRSRQLRPGVEFLAVAVDSVDVVGQQVRLRDGSVLDHDVLVVATGAFTLPEERYLRTAHRDQRPCREPTRRPASCWSEPGRTRSLGAGIATAR